MAIKPFYFINKIHYYFFFILLILAGIVWFLPLAILGILVIITNIIDYQLLKNFYLKSQKWDLNICCGDTDGKGINADIVKQKIPNFVLIENIYNLPFENKQFKNVFCSHTMEHIEKPDDFFMELKRVSENVVILVPPVWDIAAVLAVRQHKWQFLTLKTKHRNYLPKKVRLPYWQYQKKLGQKISNY